MADFKDKLKPYYDELSPLFTELEWYAGENEMQTIDDKMAVLTYTHETSFLASNIGSLH